MNRTQTTATRLLATLCLASTWACSSVGYEPTDEVQQAVQQADIDIRRSLVVTDHVILQRFALERVLQQLIDQSSSVGLTPTQLFQSWWDTQNPTPVPPDPSDPVTHCDDPSLATRLNGFPYDCRPAPSEGFQSTCDPFDGNPQGACIYIPIGLFNRFDQAPEDGSHCGEYRIVYAKETGITENRNRNLLIFEANMPNPLPAQGLKGCKKIVDVWADLTDEEDIQLRADALEEFYFDGHGNVPPVISVERFGDNPDDLGQIRTNQFIDPQTGWQLREFKLLEDCSSGPCTLLFEPVTNKVNAFGGLFDPGSSAAQAADFRAFFPSQVASLAGNSLDDISMSVPDQFNTGRSVSSGSDEMRYLVNLGVGASDLRAAIGTELTALGSTLSADDIVLRAQAMSCAGCHRLNNNVDVGGGLVWPSASGFVHVDERTTEVVNGVSRFLISDALENVFLPHRKQVVDDFLNDKPKVPKGPKVPIGGSRSHG